MRKPHPRTQGLLAGRVLRPPLISWIYDTLQRDGTHSTARSYFFDKLEGEFGDLAEEQLNIAIRWARQAELFAYNDDTGEWFEFLAAGPIGCVRGSTRR